VRRALPCLALLALLATSARAGGVNLRWTRCYGDGGVVNRTFACAANTGTNILVGSFVLDNPLPLVSSNEMVLDVTTAAGTLPAWWQFKNVGTCRQTSLTFNVSANPNDVVCSDWTQGMAAGGIGSYTVGTLGPNTAQIKVVVAVPISGYSDLAANQEYFSFNLTINNQKTVGAGACAGCTVPACIALTSLKVNFDSGNSSLTLNTPANPMNSSYVFWQDGTGIVPFANGNCAGADTAGFAVTTSVVGRGSVVRSRIKAEYPPGSPLTLTATPLPGDKFVAWSGDTTTTQPTLNIVVTHALNYVATFEKDPAAAPHTVSVTDFPGDEGSMVLVTWDPSPLDGPAAPGFIGWYRIQRQPLSPPGAAWMDNQLYQAVQAPLYQLAGNTAADSTGSDPADYRWRVVALAAADTLSWVSNEVLGHSVDNLAPPAPASVSGSIASGFATFFWPAVDVPDLDHYTVYRAADAAPPIDAAHRIGTTTNTGYNDSPGYFAHYSVTALDVHGNEGAATALTPSNTTGTDGRPVPGALTVGQPTPSPMATSMSMSLGLPRDMNVTVDVVDAQGRLLRRISDGVRSAGWLSLTWDARDARGGQAPAGIYFIRVRTPAGERIRRLALLP
jgi:hypothetical protein